MFLVFFIYVFIKYVHRVGKQHFSPNVVSSLAIFFFSVKVGVFPNLVTSNFFVYGYRMLVLPSNFFITCHLLNFTYPVNNPVKIFLHSRRFIWSWGHKFAGASFACTSRVTENVRPVPLTDIRLLIVTTVFLLISSLFKLNRNNEEQTQISKEVAKENSTHFRLSAVSHWYCYVLTPAPFSSSSVFCCSFLGIR